VAEAAEAEAAEDAAGSARCCSGGQRETYGVNDEGRCVGQGETGAVGFFADESGEVRRRGQYSYRLGIDSLRRSQATRQEMIEPVNGSRIAYS